MICSKNWIVWAIHCMKLVSPKHRFSTKSQFWSTSSFFKSQNCECWNFTALCSQILWRKKVRRVGNGHRFAAFCCCREGPRKMPLAWNENRVGATANKGHEIIPSDSLLPILKLCPPILLYGLTRTRDITRVPVFILWIRIRISKH